jgi:hypothetical protein
VDQFLAQNSSLLGLVALTLGIFYVAYGLRQYPRLRPMGRALTHVAANAVACGLALYLAFGAIQVGTHALVDVGFLFAHVIVVGMVAGLVSGLLVAFVPTPDAATCARFGFRLRRFAWGLLAGFAAGPIVGVLMELLLSVNPVLRFAPPGRGLLLLGDIFGMMAGWLVVAPVTGLVNVGRVVIEGRVSRMPQGWLPSAGIALVLVGAMLTGWFAPFSETTAHAIAHAIVLPLVNR